MEWKIIGILPRWQEEAEKFADEVNPTTNYVDSKQPRSNRTWRNHKDGKLAEFVVGFLYNADHRPDTQIYKGRKKSWDADLQVNGKPCAVKSQTLESFLKYQPSMTFQCGARRKDKILSEPNSQVIYCLLLDNIALISPPFAIRDLKFGDPKLPKLIGEKTVAYLEKSHPKLIKEARMIIEEENK